MGQSNDPPLRTAALLNNAKVHPRDAAPGSVRAISLQAAGEGAPPDHAIVIHLARKNPVIFLMFFHGPWGDQNVGITLAQNVNTVTIAMRRQRVHKT